MRRPNLDLKVCFLLGMCAGAFSLHLLRPILMKRQQLKKILLDLYPVEKLSTYSPRDFLIVAHGPGFPKNMLLEMAENKHIVALDGAADYLTTLGILPNSILGDFDSIKNTEYWGIKKTFHELKDDAKPYLGNHGVQIIPAKNQDLTDLQKAIRFCSEKNAESIHIACATGGRHDHSIHNIRNLRSEYKEERPIYLHTETQTLQYLKDGKGKIAGRVNDYCGILAFPNGAFSSEGLEYGDKDNKFPLQFGFSESACNRLKAPVATIQVTGEVILIMPGFFPSQRQFEEKQASERLSLLFKESKRVTSLFTIGQLAKAFPAEFESHIKSKLPQSASNSEEVLFSLPDEDSLKLVLSHMGVKR